MMDFYNSARVNIEAVVAPQIKNDPNFKDGEVLREAYIKALASFFQQIRSKLDK